MQSKLQLFTYEIQSDIPKHSHILAIEKVGIQNLAIGAVGTLNHINLSAAAGIIVVAYWQDILYVISKQFRVNKQIN